MINIKVKEVTQKKTRYADLEPGDVFGWSSGQIPAIGIKAKEGFFWLHDIQGTLVFRNKDDFFDSVLTVQYLGKLTGIETEIPFNANALERVR